MDVSEELEKVSIMAKREAVIKALSHEYVFPVPYCLNMTDDVARRVTEVPCCRWPGEAACRTHRQV